MYQLSIIIPVYNAEKYLPLCIEGLSKQTYGNLEFVFVDDCSTDSSIDILQQYQKLNPSVQVLKTKHNGGASAARNLGIIYAHGEYIGFCDADDFCKPYMFESMMKMTDKYSADIVCCALERVDDYGKVLSELWTHDGELVLSGQEALNHWLLGQYLGNSVDNKIFRRSLWEGIRFPEGQVFEESHVIPNLLLRAKKVIHSGTDGYCYYVRDNSITMKPFSQSRMVVYDRMNYLNNLISEKAPKSLKYYVAFRVRQNIAMMYKAIPAKRHKQISRDDYLRIRKEFYAVCPAALFSPVVRIEYKIRIAEILVGLAYFRVK